MSIMPSTDNNRNQDFRPKFINRLSDIPCLPLQEKDMEKIVHIQLSDVRKRFEEMNIQLEFSPNVWEHLAKVGYDPTFGARPLKRIIQNQVINLLSTSILQGKIHPGQTICLKLKQDQIQLEAK